MNKYDKRVTAFLNYCQYEKNLSPKTIKAYTIDLKQYKDHFISTSLVEEAFNKIALKDYLFHINKLYKPKTIKRKLATLKAFFTFLEFEDYILQSPFRKIRMNFKEPKTLPKTIRLHEVKKIFKIVYASKYKISNNEYSLRRVLKDIAIIELLFATGIRVSELSELKQENVDLRSKSIKVVGKGNKERVIQFCNQETVLAIKEYYTAFVSEIKSSGYFFVNRNGNKLSNQSIRTIIKKYAKLAGIQRTITPHVFRHTFATLLLDQGVDIRYIQNLLGHSSILTTQIYTHVSQKKQQQILSKKHPRRNFSMALLS